MGSRVLIVCEGFAADFLGHAVPGSYFARLEERPGGGVTVFWSDIQAEAAVFDDITAAEAFSLQEPLTLFEVSFAPAPGSVEGRRLAVACLGLADGSSAGELDGAWLVSYDPAGSDGRGDGTWSRDPADAARFTAEEWTALYAAVPANRPVREDGKPNRPITMFNVMVVPVDPGQFPSILPEPRSGTPSPPPPAPPPEPVNLADELRAMGLM
jgi:hypothetical protein